MAGGTRLDVKDLAAVNGAELAALSRLQVSEQQDVWGGSFAESIAAWDTGPRDKVLGLCVLWQGAPVGMTLFKRPPASPDWARPDAATMHGLKIALPWQGQGLGPLALQGAVARLKLEWRACKVLMLAVDADNHAARAVYRRGGMVDEGPETLGNHGPEQRMTLAL